MGFELPRVTRCCFCVPLRVASLIIGYVFIILSILAIAATSVYIYLVARFVKENEANPDPQHTPDQVKKMSISLYVTFAFYLLAFVYSLVINLLLVIGVHQEKANLVKFYILRAYILLGTAIAMVILSCVFMGFLAAIPMLKWAVTILFCIIIVRSTYLEMEERNKPKTFEMQNLYMPQRPPQDV